MAIFSTLTGITVRVREVAAGGLSHTDHDIPLDSPHGVVLDSLPAISMQVEQNVCEFTSGDLTFTARNEDGWWDGTIFTPDLNPLWVYPSTAVIKILRDGLPRWEGDVDLKTVTFNRKEKTVSFTALSALKRLERASAERVSRYTYHATYNPHPIKREVDWGYPTSVVGSVITDGRAYRTAHPWAVNALAGHVLVQITDLDAIAYFPIASNTANTITVTGTPDSSLTTLYLVRPIQLDGDGDSGQCTVDLGESGYVAMIDSTKNWLLDRNHDPITNRWAGKTVVDADGVIFILAPYGSLYNDATHLYLPKVAGMQVYPREGDYSVGGRLLALQGQTAEESGLLPGDQLQIVALKHWAGHLFRRGGRIVPIGPEPGGGGADPSLSWKAPRYSVAQQNVTIAYVGPATLGDLVLSGDEIFLADDLQYPLMPGDAIVCTTPYFRNKTVLELAVMLFSSMGANVTHSTVSVDSYADNNVVPYADFDGKTVMEALLELAAISNCVLSVRFEDTGGDDSAHFYFTQRGVGVGTPTDLTGYVMEQSDTLLFEQFYAGVRVSGPDGLEVRRGNLGTASQVLEVSSDFMSTYDWLAQVADRLWNFFRVMRMKSDVSVVAEIPFATGTSTSGLETFEGMAVGQPVNPAAWKPLWGDGTWLVGNEGGNNYLAGTRNSPNSINYLYWAAGGNANTDVDLVADMMVGNPAGHVDYAFLGARLNVPTGENFDEYTPVGHDVTDAAWYPTTRWEAGWGTGTWYVQSEVGQIVLVSPPNSSGYVNSLYYTALGNSGGGDVTDLEVYADLRMGSGANPFAGLGFRMSGTTSKSGYTVGFGIYGLEIIKAVSNVLSVLAGPLDFGATQGIWYKIHVLFSGGTISANVWPRGASEPGGWMLTATDGSPIASGYFGVVNSQNSDNNYYDNITFGSASAGGDTGYALGIGGDGTVAIGKYFGVPSALALSTANIPGSSPPAPVTHGVWYKTRFQIVGSPHPVLKAKVWVKGTAEPDDSSWLLTYTDSSADRIDSGYLGVGCLYAYVDSGNRYDNIGSYTEVIPGTMSGFNLLDIVTLDGHDWIVWGITEPTENAPGKIDLVLVQSTDTVTPDVPADESVDRSTPAPPVVLPENVVSVGDIGDGDFTVGWDIYFTYDSDPTKLAGFRRTAWEIGKPRPDRAANPYPTGNDVSVGDVTWPVRATRGGVEMWLDSFRVTDAVYSLWHGSGSGTFKMTIDYQAVLTDGRSSNPSDTLVDGEAVILT